MIVATDGDAIELSDGTRLLDFTSGLLCTNAGHRNERIRSAIVEALDRDGFVWEAWATDYRSRAAKLIVEDLLGPDDWAGRVRFTSSGSEAIELALLVAKLVTGRPNVITRDFAYHGWTTGALSLMGLPGSRGILAAADSDEIRRPAGVPMPGVHFAPAPYCFSCPIGHTYPACKRGGDTLACIDSLEHLIRTLGPDSIAAVVAEPIFGVGMFHPPEEYLLQLRELTRTYGILWIDDEVMTGFGRTGKAFAYQHSPGVTPDLMTLGKGMVSAALPAGGVVMSRAVSEVMDRYRWETVSTFAGHPVVAAAVVANIEWLIEERVPERATTLGLYLGSRLQELAATHPCVAEVAGAGLLWAVESSAPTDRASGSHPTTDTVSPRACRHTPRRSSSRENARSAASPSRPHRRTHCASARLSTRPRRTSTSASPRSVRRSTSSLGSTCPAQPRDEHRLGREPVQSILLGLLARVRTPLHRSRRCP